MGRGLAIVPPTLPNVLTLGRIALVPVLAALVLEAGAQGSMLAASVFAAAILTDALDGYLARSRSLVTTFGTVMDPIADKLLIGGALVCLVAVDRLAGWVAAVVLARELAVTGLRAFVGRSGLIVPADTLGKAKTALQAVSVLALITVTDVHAEWLQALVYSTVAVTLLSGANYFLAYRRRVPAPQPTG